MTNDQEHFIKKQQALTRHIDNVRRFCYILGPRLIEGGESQLGLQLMANSHLHDNSKFHGVEWLYLNDEVKEKHPDLFKLGFAQHIITNLHHPEAWHGGIHAMPKVYLAEMTADWAARSAEFGTDLREWIKNKATKKYKMAVQTKTYKTIKDFVDLLLQPEFN